MSKKLTSSESKSVGHGFAASDVKWTLFAAAVSATFRMVVPVLGLFVIGLMIDFILNQKAFYAIIGAVVGFLIAAGLIYLQIKKLKITSKTSLSAKIHGDTIKAEKGSAAAENGGASSLVETKKSAASSAEIVKNPTKSARKNSVDENNPSDKNSARNKQKEAEKK